MFPVAQEGDFPDLPTNSWFDYAANEGIARAFDLFDRHGVKASSFMTGTSFAIPIRGPGRRVCSRRDWT
jgi:peptidoglycan/xylan/chitin deacetylase (PgdA/CDA1 family)